MISYGTDAWEHLEIVSIEPQVERRNSHYIDIDCTLIVERNGKQEHLEQFTAFVVMNNEGQILESVPREEGCECEVQFTPIEKERLHKLVQEHPEIKAFLYS